ncbi:hypothetical protein A2U01_0084335, partial [Trifolium medium]|nr:hypothetical protein [Trifolium medium]
MYSGTEKTGETKVPTDGSTDLSDQKSDRVRRCSDNA